MDTVGDTLAQRKPFRHLLAAPWFYNLGFAAAKRIPLSSLYGVADFLGIATYLTCGALVRTVRANLARAFPQASERDTSSM